MKKRRTRTIGEGKFIRLMSRGGWEFVERKNISGIVGIVAVTRDDKLLLVEQYRPPVKSRVIEIPAGLAGDVRGSEDEAMEIAAKRELLEETGYEAQRMKWLMDGAASAGITSEISTLFYATGLKKVGRGGGDASEDIEVHEIPLKRVGAWLARRAKAGAIIDFKVYAAIYFVGKMRRQRLSP